MDPVTKKSLDTLRRKFGSWGAVARHMGLGEQTLRDWRHGKVPSPKARLLIWIAAYHPVVLEEARAACGMTFLE